MWYFELTREEDFARSHVIEVLMEIHKNRRFNYFCFVLLVECTRTGRYCLSRTQFGERYGRMRTYEERKKLVQSLRYYFISIVIWILDIISLY
jgi:hypothetical protein